MSFVPEHFHSTNPDSYKESITNFTSARNAPSWYRPDSENVRTYVFEDVEYMKEWYGEAVAISENETYFDRTRIRVISMDGWWIAPFGKEGSIGTVVRLSKSSNQPVFTGDEEEVFM